MVYSPRPMCLLAARKTFMVDPRRLGLCEGGSCDGLPWIAIVA
jgi:hypothetical protein